MRVPVLPIGLILSASLSGCAVKYPIAESYSEATIGEARAAPAVEPMNRPIVGLRFPARIDSAIVEAITRKYRLDRHYGRPAADFPNPAALDENALQIAMAKTLFYVLHFQRYLNDQLPEIDTVLIPSTIIQREGRWVLESNESILAPWVLVDFFAYVHPFTHIHSFSTFGHYLAPMIWIRTDPIVSPGTRGAIAGDYYVRDMARVGAGHGAWAALGATIVDLLNSATNDPKKLNGILDEVSTADRPWRPNVFLKLPVSRLKLRRDTVIGTDVKKYAFPESFLAYTNLIRDAVDALIAADYENVWLDQYAARYRGDSAEGIDAAERGLLYRMRAIEFRFLNEQDVTYANLVSGSVWSRSLWRLREKEIGAQKKQAAIRWVTPWLMVIGAPLWAAIGVSWGADIQINNTIFAMLDDVASRQAKFSFALSDRAEQISVSSYDELTSRLREIYEQCNPKTVQSCEKAAHIGGVE